MWDLPGSGTEPVSPALAGGFFTTEPPGNPGVNFCWLLYLLTVAHLLFLFLCKFSNLKNCTLDIWLIFCRDSGFSYVSLKRIEFCFSRQWVFKKDWCWSWNSNTLATWCEELTHLKRPWCWERLRAGGEGDTTEDEMVGWHHCPNGHEFGWTLGAGDGQGGLACCGSWGCKESDTTEWLNWTELQHWCTPEDRQENFFPRMQTFLPFPYKLYKISWPVATPSTSTWGKPCYNPLPAIYLLCHCSRREAHTYSSEILSQLEIEASCYILAPILQNLLKD